MSTAHIHQSQPAPEPTGIVSVNSRGGATQGVTGKLALAALVVCLLIAGAVTAFSKYRAAKHADETASKIAATAQNTPAETGKRRIFDTDPPPIPGSSAAKPATSSGAGACPDRTSGQPLLGPDGKQLTAPSGQPIRVCTSGQVIVPAIVPLPGDIQPIPVVPHQQRNAPTPATAAPKSRYGGDVLLPAGSSAGAMPALDLNNPYIHALLRANQPAAIQAATSQAIGAPAASGLSSDSAPPAGSLGPLLRGSEPRPVAATMIGNRDMILPEGRSIDCNLSVRLINEVSGKATCVLSSNVYSDNGKVVLAERGSTAVGEYVAIAAQGQRRLFVLWTRLQTPNGVVINVNSPAADSLGTSGLPGHVDNRWPERIGAAVLLSLVEDVIAYETAKAASENGGGAQGVAVFQGTSQTGRSLAERILESTINIKPTIFKNQGDRATIFVSRDLDFGSVYALRAK